MVFNGIQSVSRSPAIRQPPESLRYRFCPAISHVHRLIFALVVVLLALSSTGCSLIIRKAGEALVSGNSVYATDDDPDLVWEAVPFGLKTIEGLLVKAPKSKKLLLAAASGFTRMPTAIFSRMRTFSRPMIWPLQRHFGPGHGRCIAEPWTTGSGGSRSMSPTFATQLEKDPQAAVSKLRKKHVPLLYWTANAWGAAISISKDDPELSADQNLVEALMRRALALDEAWEHGSIHDFFISYEGGRASIGGSLAKAREHFERAKQLSQGMRVAPLVSYAETVSVSTQNKKEFQSLLEEALAFDANKAPETRMANLIVAAAGQMAARPD